IFFIFISFSSLLSPYCFFFFISFSWKPNSKKSSTAVLCNIPLFLPCFTWQSQSTTTICRNLSSTPQIKVQVSRKQR
ncbi:hypothetical protein Tsubulata_036351, partial [Turnera subulata]